MSRTGTMVFVLVLAVLLTGCQQLRLGKLHRAAERGDNTAILALLDRGTAIDGVDGEGNTPLHTGAEAGHDSVVRLLVERGAAVSSQHPCALPCFPFLCPALALPPLRRPRYQPGWRRIHADTALPAAGWYPFDSHLGL